MSDLIIAGGIVSGIALVLYGCLPHVTTARNEVRFARYKRDVRALWKAEVKADEDIIAVTGDDPWWHAFINGRSPAEAIFDT